MNVTEVIRTGNIQNIVVACKASYNMYTHIISVRRGSLDRYLHVRLAVGKIRAPGVLFLLPRLAR